MDSPELPDAPDWDLLRSLFPAGEKFRHKMGLRRREFADFYAPTTAGAAIRREKEIILGKGPSVYTATSEQGQPAFRELAEIIGQKVDVPFDAWTATHALSLRIEPDFLLLTPPDWTLIWASVCFPSRWSLEGKLHRSLHEIHSPVPGLNAELGTKISTFFTRLPTGEGWNRANWGLSASAESNQHPVRFIPELRADAATEEAFIRIEDQHLLKLPQTGVMAFGIRVRSYQLSNVVGDKDVLAGLQERLKTMPSEIARYKGLAQFLTKTA